MANCNPPESLIELEDLGLISNFVHICHLTWFMRILFESLVSASGKSHCQNFSRWWVILNAQLIALDIIAQNLRFVSLCLFSTYARKEILVGDFLLIEMMQNITLNMCGLGGH
jgi:hypothetical protein